MPVSRGAPASKGVGLPYPAREGARFRFSGTLRPLSLRNLRRRARMTSGVIGRSRSRRDCRPLRSEVRLAAGIDQKPGPFVDEAGSVARSPISASDCSSVNLASRGAEDRAVLQMAFSFQRGAKLSDVRPGRHRSAPLTLFWWATRGTDRHRLSRRAGGHVSSFTQVTDSPRAGSC